jgi:MFS family permease
MGIQIGSGAIGGFIAPILVGWFADSSGYRFAFSLMIIPLAFAVIMIHSMKAPNIISDKI